MLSLKYIFIFGLFLILLTAMIISLLSPPMGDTWGYIILEPESRTPIGLLRSYFRGYMFNNPRLGQFILLLSGYGPTATAFANTASLILLIVGGASVVLGRFFNPLNWPDSAVAIIWFSVLIYSGINIGQMLFYIPYNANYVFGFGLLTFFMALVQLGNDRHPTAVTIAVIPVGILAGLTNEHTSPAFLLAGVFIYALRLFGLFEYRLHLRYFTGFFSLLTGYLLLYFAPGQDLRYGDRLQKNSGIERFFTNFEDQLERVTSLLLTDSAPFYVLTFVLLALASYQYSRTKECGHKLFWSSFFLFVSIMMALTTALSPIIKPRLMFASYAALAFSFSGLISFLEKKSIVIVTGLLSFSLCAVWLGKAMILYIDLNRSFRAHEQELFSAHEADIPDPVFRPYYSNEYFIKNKEYMRDENFSDNPDDRLNLARASVYGLPSVRYETSSK